MAKNIFDLLKAVAGSNQQSPQFYGDDVPTIQRAHAAMGLNQEVTIPLLPDTPEFKLNRRTRGAGYSL
jgi:hypothetical protein